VIFWGVRGTPLSIPILFIFGDLLQGLFLYSVTNYLTVSHPSYLSSFPMAGFSMGKPGFSWAESQLGWNDSLFPSLAVSNGGVPNGGKLVV
jgi:hypothetical protein